MDSRVYLQVEMEGADPGGEKGLKQDANVDQV